MNSERLSELLRSILLAIKEDIGPEVETPQSKHRLALVDMMLTRLIAEMDSTVSQLHKPEDALPVEAIDALHSDSHSSINTVAAEYLQAINEFSMAEQQWRTAIEALVVQGVSNDSGGVRSNEELSISTATFSDLVQAHLGQKAIVEKVNVVPGGRSKGTLLLEMAAGQADIVIRRDFSNSIMGVPVTYEYPVIQAVWREGVPVPEPLWLEPDAELIGGAFIAFERIPGRAMGTLFESTAPPAIAVQFAETLAKVHAIDIDAAGLAENINWGTEAQPVRAMVDSFYQRYRERLDRLPLVDAAFAWLYLQMEAIGNQRVLVHGDASLHNVMGEGEQLTALLDWELSHAGDPAEDLCYCRPVIQTILPWADFLEAYQAAGGAALSEPRMHFFSVWRTLQLAIQMGGAKTMFESGQDRDLRVAAIGFNSFPKILSQLASDLAAAGAMA